MIAQPESRSATLRGSEGPLADRHDVLLLDLDGTVWLSGQLIPHALEVLTGLAAAGVRPVYVTNNASRSAADVAAQLRTGGLPAAEADVVTSAQAAAALVTGLVPAGSSVLVVGSAALVDQVEQHGLSPVRAHQMSGAQLRDPGRDGSHEVRAVLQGLATDTGWGDLAAASHAVAAGAVWVAANVDATLPTPDGLSPGNGSLVGVVSVVTGRTPVVAGKPERPLIDAAVERTGARTPLVVGDRLDTDLAAAVATALPGLLVLTGVSQPVDLLAAPPGQRPRFLARDLRGLRHIHPGPRPVDGGWACGDWRAATHDGLVTVHLVPSDVADPDQVPAATGMDDGLDGLRALAEAVWEQVDAVGGEPEGTADALQTVLAPRLDPPADPPALGHTPDATQSGPRPGRPGADPADGPVPARETGPGADHDLVPAAVSDSGTAS